MYSVLFRLDSSSIGILESVNKVLQNHIGLKGEFEQLTRPVSELEAKIQSDASEKIPLICEERLSKMENQFDQFERKLTSGSSSGEANAHSPTTHEASISKMEDKVDDLENRSRRCNLLFYGLSDSEQNERWETPERLVQEFCDNHLGLKVSSIAGAHRLGHFTNDKKRAIIAKFFNDKEVEAIIGYGYKLKGKPFSISRD